MPRPCQPKANSNSFWAAGIGPAAGPTLDSTLITQRSNRPEPAPGAQQHFAGCHYIVMVTLWAILPCLNTPHHCWGTAAMTLAWASSRKWPNVLVSQSNHRAPVFR